MAKKNKKVKMSRKEVEKIARQTTLSLAETKVIRRLSENTQLNHNTTDIRGPFLQNIARGLSDQTAGLGNSARIGDEILLQNLKLKFWLSNKLDRPNVMYRITVFWFAVSVSGSVPVESDIYNTPSGNKMVSYLNRERISVISDRFVKSTNSYAPDYEHSYLHNQNANWKSKKITYSDNGTDAIGAMGQVKGKDIFVAITPYDAYGTLTTDNIASYALNYQVAFKDL